MDINHLISLIDVVLLEVNDFVTNSKYYTLDKEPFSDFKKVLDLLKLEIQNNPNNINERVLRAVHDIGGITAKSFENTSLEGTIFNFIDILSNEIPKYRKLEPLRMDFGKGDPI